MKHIFLTSLMALFFVACSYKSTTDSSYGDWSYLKFETKNSVLVSVDGSEFFEAKGGSNVYKIKSGKNRVKVTDKAGNLLYDRDLYIGNQSTYTIDVKGIK